MIRTFLIVMFILGKKNITNVNGINLIPIYLRFIYHFGLVREKYVIWLSYSDFLKKEIVYHHEFKPARIIVNDNNRSFMRRSSFYKHYMKNSEYNNNGDYDIVAVAKNTDEKSITIDKFFHSRHSFVKPCVILERLVWGPNKSSIHKERAEVWLAYDNLNRFNGPSQINVVNQKITEEYYLKGVKIPDNIIRFKDGIPSKELNQNSVLEAMLFDRAYGKAVSIVYKTQNIPTEEEIYKCTENIYE